MSAAGANVLAIEGNCTILLDEDEFRLYAVQHNISVIALDSRTISEAAA
jgi:hypothetical protein